MKDHAGDIKRYVHDTEAWYAQSLPRDKGCVDEVTFGFYSPQGGTSGEMCVRWREMDGEAVPYLMCYDDAWHALAQLTDVLALMGEKDDALITPVEFCILLEQCGFVDNTPRRYEDSYPSQLERAEQEQAPE